MTLEHRANHSKQSIQKIFSENNNLLLFVLENMYGLVLSVFASTYTNCATLAADLLLFYPGYNHGNQAIVFKFTILHQDIYLTHLTLRLLNLVSCLILAWAHNGSSVIYPSNNRLYTLQGLHVS